MSRTTDLRSKKTILIEFDAYQLVVKEIARRKALKFVQYSRKEKYISYIIEDAIKQVYGE